MKSSKDLRKVYNGSWRGVRAVTEMNSRTFCIDFFRVRTVYSMATRTVAYVECKRGDVWQLAKRTKISYVMRNDILPSGRTVMLIL